MPVTALDDSSALLVIDLQEGIVSLPTIDPAAVVWSAGRASRAFRSAGRPVVLVNVAGGAPGRNELPKSSRTPAPNWTDLVPQLGTVESDHRVTKKNWDRSPDRPARLPAEGGRHTRRAAGIATSIGVESTARSATNSATTSRW